MYATQTHSLGANRTRKVVLAFAIAAMALSGCAPSAPAPTPSAVEPDPLVTPTAEPAPEVEHYATTLVITGQSVSVLDETSAVIVELPYTSDGVAAATSLAAALGVDPTATAVGGTNCSRPGTLYDWGGFELHSAGVITMAPDASFSVLADAATTVGISVEGPHGLQVGATTADILAADPAMLNYDYGFGITMFALDIRSGVGFDTVVTQGAVQGGALVGIQSPVFILGDC